MNAAGGVLWRLFRPIRRRVIMEKVAHDFSYAWIRRIYGVPTLCPCDGCGVARLDVKVEKNGDGVQKMHEGDGFPSTRAMPCIRICLEN